MPNLDIRYTGVATAEDGRHGRVSSEDGALDVLVYPPDGVDYKVKSMARDMARSAPQNGNGNGNGTGSVPITNPEQLFAAGYSSSFHGALGAVAVVANLDVTGSQVTAKVAIGKDKDEGLELEIELCVHVPDVDEPTVRKLAKFAHQIDPYSIALSGVDVKLTVV